MNPTDDLSQKLRRYAAHLSEASSLAHHAALMVNIRALRSSTVVVPAIIMAAAVAVIVVAINSIPDPYDRAIVVRICRDGNRIFRMEDGKYRALRPGALHGYKVENPETVCR